MTGRDAMGKKLAHKRVLYWLQIEAAICETGLRIDAEHEVRAECAKCSCALVISDQSIRGGRFLYQEYRTGMLSLKVCSDKGGKKSFPELKKGGFNLPKLVEFLKAELAEAHRQHETRLARSQNRTSAGVALRAAVEALALPDLWNDDWRGELADDYAAGLARPQENGTVKFVFEVPVEQVKTVLRLLVEQGIAKENSDA